MLTFDWLNAGKKADDILSPNEIVKPNEIAPHTINENLQGYKNLDDIKQTNIDDIAKPIDDMASAGANANSNLRRGFVNSAVVSNALAGVTGGAIGSAVADEGNRFNGFIAGAVAGVGAIHGKAIASEIKEALSKTNGLEYLGTRLKQITNTGSEKINGDAIQKMACFAMSVNLD